MHFLIHSYSFIYILMHILVCVGVLSIGENPFRASLKVLPLAAGYQHLPRVYLYHHSGTEALVTQESDSEGQFCVMSSLCLFHSILAVCMDTYVFFMCLVQLSHLFDFFPSNDFCVISLTKFFLLISYENNRICCDQFVHNSTSRPPQGHLSM